RRGPAALLSAAWSWRRSAHPYLRPMHQPRALAQASAERPQPRARVFGRWEEVLARCLYPPNLCVMLQPGQLLGARDGLRYAPEFVDQPKSERVCSRPDATAADVVHALGGQFAAAGHSCYEAIVHLRDVALEQGAFGGVERLGAEHHGGVIAAFDALYVHPV